MTPGSAVPKAGVAAAQRDRSHSALQRPASSAGSYWPASARLRPLTGRRPWRAPASRPSRGRDSRATTMRSSAQRSDLGLAAWHAPIQDLTPFYDPS